MSEFSSRGAAELQVPAYVSIRQRLAYVSIRQLSRAYTSAYVSFCELISLHTSAEVSSLEVLRHWFTSFTNTRENKIPGAHGENVFPDVCRRMLTYALTCVTSEVLELMIYQPRQRIPQHTSGYVGEYVTSEDLPALPILELMRP